MENSGGACLILYATAGVPTCVMANITHEKRVKQPLTMLIKFISTINEYR